MFWVLFLLFYSLLSSIACNVYRDEDKDSYFPIYYFSKFSDEFYEVINRLLLEFSLLKEFVSF